MNHPPRRGTIKFGAGSIMIYAALLLALLAVLPAPLNAEIRHVPDDYDTIQEAIIAAQNGDQVLVAPGRYIGHIDFLGKTIVVASHFLESRDPEDIVNTIIDTNGGDRVVSFTRQETNQSQLIGFTITGGAGRTYGGGVYCSNASPVLDHLIIRDNSATLNGAGLYSTANARPILRNVTITQNTAQNIRGGVHVYSGGTTTMINSIVYGNQPAGNTDGQTVTYSPIEGGYAGEGNINDDPRFLDPNNNDFSLAENSPCIDNGDPNAEDPDGTRSDIGAIYFRQVPDISVSPEALDFGEVHVGQSVRAEARIINLGQMDLIIESIVLAPEDAPFQIVQGGDLAALEPGVEQIIRIEFNPVEIGQAQAELVVLSDDPDEAEVRIALTGLGLPPVPNILIETARLLFGQTPLGGESNQALAIQNLGEAPLTISNIQIQGDSADVFAADFQQPIEVEPQSQVDITITYAPRDLGSASANLIVTSDDPDEDEIVISLSGEGVLPDRHFEYRANTGANASLLIMAARIGDEPLTFGSEIGVFSPEGLCCGGDYWLGARVGMPAWGDNVITEAVDGLRSEEEMSFRFWDIATQQEIPAVPTFIRGNEIYLDNAVAVLELDDGEGRPDEFYIVLTPGWNMVSAPIIPEDNNVINLWQPLVEADMVSMVKDHAGRFYRPDFGFCNIPFWDHHYGYQVRALDVCSLRVVGNLIPADEPVPLAVGWSIVAYYPAAAVLAPAAFRNIVNDLEIAKDVAGRFYLPAWGFSNMLPLVRGQGYQTKVTRALNLVWNVPGGRVAGIITEAAPQLRHFTPPDPTGFSMSVLIICGDESKLTGEIGLFTPEGRCIGASAGDGIWGVAAWGDDISTLQAEGAAEGQSFIVRKWNGNTEQELPVIWKQGEAIYQTDAYAVGVIDDRLLLPDRVALEPLYPNPFNAIANLRFSLPEAMRVRITLVDVNGRTNLVLAEGEYRAGWHQLAFNAEGLPSGIYLARLTCNAGSFERKVVLFK
ncbi:MAG: choice-of-anchor D domain-containing protein [Calditrichota bacterium]